LHQSKLLFSTFNASVIAFLQEFQPNSLLTNVNLECSEFLLQNMANFLPLVTVNSIKFNSYDLKLLDQVQCEYFELAIPLLTSARILIARLVFTSKLLKKNFSYNCRDSWFSGWLNTPREDGKPRVLILGGYQDDEYDRFSHSHFYLIQYIKKVCKIILEGIRKREAIKKYEVCL
jgi:hypothetical protein